MTLLIYNINPGHITKAFSKLELKRSVQVLDDYCQYKTMGTKSFVEIILNKDPQIFCFSLDPNYSLNSGKLHRKVNDRKL